MNTQKIKSFSIIGISVRTTNENEQAMKDIPGLWNKFMSENIMEKRSRMKIMLFDANKDLPIKTIKNILQEAIDLYINGIIKI